MQKKEELVTTSVRLPKEVHKELKLLSIETSLTIENLVREFIVLGIREHNRE